MRARFWVGGVVLAAAAIYLIASGISSSAQYYLTVRELRSKGQTLAGRNLRVSGFVIGSSIVYHPQTGSLTFEIVDTRQELGAAAADTLKVLYTGPRPDLLQHEAQAIVEGRLNPDGTFTADNLLLKCPSRYQDQITTPTLMH